MPKWPVTLAIVVLPVAALADSSHDVNATFVSADAKNKIFTVKLEDGTTSTGKAEGNAAKQLADLKYGDKVVVTCKDNDKGEHVAATDIKVAK
jgi:translation initiation factor IF-1